MTTTPTSEAPEAISSPAEPSPRRGGSLFRAEVHRFSARRFIRWLLALAVVVYLIIVTLVGLTQFSKPNAGVLADAERKRDQVIVEQQQFREQCLNDPKRPSDVPVEEVCGPEPSADQFRVEDFIDPPAFKLATGLPNGAVAIGVASAMLAFLIGATYVGAEWSSRSMVALLFWVPRRIKVMAVKLAVTAAAAALLGVLAQAVWWGTAEILARTRGNRDNLPVHFWSDLFGQQGRSVLFVVLAALLGFGIANLIRNTGASLGVGFVYFAVIETAVRGFRPRWQEWLLTDNAAALVLNGGHKIFIYEGAQVDDQGQFVETPREIVVSNLQGGLVLGIVTAVIVVTGVVLFKRRDLH
ncbi:MAG: ABC transporter permease subunit [Sporichthyaceae bacterium]